MTNNNENDHHVRFEVASERRTIREYSLIPESDPAAKEQHISEHLMLQDIQRLAQNGDSDGVKELVLINLTTRRAQSTKHAHAPLTPSPHPPLQPPPPLPPLLPSSPTPPHSAAC